MAAVSSYATGPARRKASRMALRERRGLFWLARSGLLSAWPTRGEWKMRGRSLTEPPPPVMTLDSFLRSTIPKTARCWATSLKGLPTSRIVPPPSPLLHARKCEEIGVLLYVTLLLQSRFLEGVREHHENPLYPPKSRFYGPNKRLVVAARLGSFT